MRPEAGHWPDAAWSRSDTRAGCRLSAPPQALVGSHSLLTDSRLEAWVSSLLQAVAVERGTVVHSTEVVPLGHHRSVCSLVGMIGQRPHSMVREGGVRGSQA